MTMPQAMTLRFSTTFQDDRPATREARNCSKAGEAPCRGSAVVLSDDSDECPPKVQPASASYLCRTQLEVYIEVAAVPQGTVVIIAADNPGWVALHDHPRRQVFGQDGIWQDGNPIGHVYCTIDYTIRTNPDIAANFRNPRIGNTHSDSDTVMDHRAAANGSGAENDVTAAAKIDARGDHCTGQYVALHENLVEVGANTNKDFEWKQ